MSLTWDSLYVTILFIIPGFIAISIQRALFRENKEQSPIELFYKSLLNSCTIYFILYTALTVWGRTIPGLKQELSYDGFKMIGAILLLLLLSFIWGLIITIFQQKKTLTKTLKKFGFLQRIGQPPNVYARFFDQEFRESKEGVWVIFGGRDNLIYEGWVEYASVTGPTQEIYVTEVRILNPDRTPQRDMEEISGMIVRISDLEILEIIE